MFQEEQTNTQPINTESSKGCVISPLLICLSPIHQPDDIALLPLQSPIWRSTWRWSLRSSWGVWINYIHSCCGWWSISLCIHRKLNPFKLYVNLAPVSCHSSTYCSCFPVACPHREWMGAGSLQRNAGSLMWVHCKAFGQCHPHQAHVKQWVCLQEGESAVEVSWS